MTRRRSHAPSSRRWWPVALAGPVLLAACGGGSAPTAVPTPTSEFHIVASGYTPAQVLGWVTPTLQNGASLVSTLPPSATEAQVEAGAQQLGVSCGVSLKELGQTTWAGASHRDEQSLAATVTRIQGLIAAPPQAGLGPALRPVLVSMTAELASLQRDVG